MNASDLTMLQSWELRNICDCGGANYADDGPEYKPLCELECAGLLRCVPCDDCIDDSWFRFEPTAAGRAMAAELERQ